MPILDFLMQEKPSFRTNLLVCRFYQSDGFFTDETGSIRWLILRCILLILTIPKKLIWIKFGLKLISNAFERKITIPELTATDIAENEKETRNMHKFQWSKNSFPLILKNRKNGRISTATDIMLAMNNALGLRLNNVKIGKALTSLKYQRIKHPQLQVYGYLIKRKTE